MTNVFEIDKLQDPRFHLLKDLLTKAFVYCAGLNQLIPSPSISLPLESLASLGILNCKDPLVSGINLHIDQV